MGFVPAAHFLSALFLFFLSCLCRDPASDLREVVSAYLLVLKASCMYLRGYFARWWFDGSLIGSFGRRREKRWVRAGGEKGKGSRRMEKWDEYCASSLA
jgi:hypothetical protein